MGHSCAIKDYKNESVLRSALQEQRAALCASQGPSPRLVTGEPGSKCHPRDDLFVGDTKSHTEVAIMFWGTVSSGQDIYWQCII